METANLWLYLIVNIFHIYVFLLAYRALFGKPRHICGNQKFGSWAEVLSFSSFYIVNSVAFLILDNPLINLASSIFPLLAITFLYTGKVLTRLLMAFFLYLASMLLESASLSFLQLFGFLSSIKTELIVNLAANLMLFSIVQIYIKIKQHQRADALKSSNWFMIIALPLCSLAIVVLAYQAGYSPMINLFIVILLLAINIVVFQIYDLLLQLYITSYEYNLVQRQNEAYAHEITVIQRGEEACSLLVHDIKNHAMAMRKMLQRGQIKDLDRYLSDYIESYHVGGEYVCTGNPDVDSILNFKLDEATHIGANIEVAVVIPNILPIKPTDIVAILGNLMDNAIEALQASEEKYLRVELHSKKGMLFITIENSYKDRLAKVQREGKTVYLTKKDNPKLHNLGLTSVSRAVEKYNGMLKIDDDAQRFRVDILFPADI